MASYVIINVYNIFPIFWKVLLLIKNWIIIQFYKKYEREIDIILKKLNKNK